MYEIRFHGRGGQGAVTAATLLAVAGFKDGKFTQAFPSFGVERRGAPVQAFTRIDDEKFILQRTGVYEPDILVVLDASLFQVVDVMEGLKDNGIVIINSKKSSEEFNFINLNNARIFTVDVTSLALEILKQNIVNTGILGAFSAFTNLVKKESICQAVKENFSKEIAEKNIILVERTYEKAKERRKK